MVLAGPPRIPNPPGPPDRTEPEEAADAVPEAEVIADADTTGVPMTNAGEGAARCALKGLEAAEPAGPS